MEPDPLLSQVAAPFSRHASSAAISTALGLVLLLGSGCRTVFDLAAIADAQTAAAVKTALVNDAELGVRAIEVTVSRGIARLSGRVRSRAEVDRAAALVRSVSGVTGIDLALQLGADAAPPAETGPPPVPASAPDVDVSEAQTNPGLLAVGASLGVSRPHSDALRSRTTIGPLIRLGSGQGLGVAIAFDWFTSDFTTADADDASFARVHVRPIMAGLSYTFAADRIAVSPGLVAGVAFNSLSITETGAAAGALAVEVDNSLVWRPGVSVWFDPARRWAVNASAGYVMTGLDLTILDAGRLTKRSTSGNTLMLRAGLAYKLF